MLNRRYLRVKVLQALYAHFQTDGANLVQGEKEMMKSIDKIYDLYLMMLLLLVEVTDVARERIEAAREKRLPTEEDLNPNLKFVDNQVIRQLEENIAFKKLVHQKKLSWHPDKEHIRKLFKEIREGEDYKQYMSTRTSDFEADRKFVIKIFRNHIAEFELLQQSLEEKSIYWYDDLTLVVINIGKTIQQFRESGRPENKVLFSLYKDKEDDQQFVKELFRGTIRSEAEYEKLIAGKTQNWEVDRIAVLDVILMKMALCEFEEFRSIPVKVSLNEYIELSKSYSTPKSKVFINGILDKMVIDWKASGRIKKTGRGLIE